jgi:hypothetical protein
MSDSEQKKSLNPKVEKVLQVIRQNFIVSIVIVVATAFLAFTGLIDASQKTYNYFRVKPEPKLAVVVLDQKRAQSELTINPIWKNRFGSGFSDSIPIVIAVRNSGTAAATNVEVFLVYPPGVFNVRQSTGTTTTPAVLSDVKTMTGYEKVEKFSVGRIDVSPISNIFEKELQLQFRFRQVLAVPVIRAHLPFIVPLHIDFASSDSMKLGEFPITYVVKFSESDKPIAGTIMVRLDRSKDELLKRPDLKAVIDIVKKDSSQPALTSGKRTDVIDIHFLSDDLDALAPLVSSDCKNAKPNVVVVKAFEERNDSDVWTTFVTAEGEKVIFIDRGDDGVLDQIFMQFRNGEWWEFAPKGQAAYVALSDIVDPARDTCFAASLGSKLGIRHP